MREKRQGVIATLPLIKVVLLANNNCVHQIAKQIQIRGEPVWTFDFGDGKLMMHMACLFDATHTIRSVSLSLSGCFVSHAHAHTKANAQTSIVIQFARLVSL